MGHKQSKFKIRKKVLEPTLKQKGKHDSQEKYRIVEGRRYLNTEYALPSDDIEIDRLHIQHYLIRHIYQTNFSAPVEEKLNVYTRETIRVLDIGCGPGTWVLEMASEFTNVQFTGLDISPLFPAEIKPANVAFVQADVTKKLPFPDNYFDFVHMRLMYAALTDENYQMAAYEMARVLKPGGYIEMMEFDTAVRNAGPASERLNKASEKFHTQFGRNLIITKRLEGYIRKTQAFSEVKSVRRDIPIGISGGKLSKVYMDEVAKVMIPLKNIFSPLLNQPPSEWESFLATISREFDTHESYFNSQRSFAQKL